MNSKDIFNLSELYLQAAQTIIRLKREMDNNNYKSMHMQCYICDSPNHLALKCHKFSQKWKGNLMKVKFKKSTNINDQNKVQ